MGVGSFGGFNAGAAYMATRGFNRYGVRGGGGYHENDDNNEKDKSNFSWIWFSINTLLFSLVIAFFVIMGSDYANYSRPGQLTSKYQSEHKYKGSYYPDYYFTVKWSDRNKETETFEVGGSTFASCKVKETVYFRRMKPDYEWMKRGSGFILVMGIAAIWVISGILALCKD